MHKKVAVVLGGTGLLGKRLCQRLLDEGYSVRSVSRSGVPGSWPDSWWTDVDWIAAHLGTEACAQALRGADVVFHLASTTLPSTSNKDIPYDLESNVVATVRTLEAAASMNVSRVVFASSGGTVYGIEEHTPIRETHPTNPICSYGIHKLAIEKYLQLFRSLKQLDSISIRISNLYGEQQDLSRPLGAVAHFVSRAVRGFPIEIWGDGNITRDYVHVDDVADAFVRAAQYRGGETLINVATGRGVSLKQLVRLIQASLSSPVTVDYKPSRNFDVKENILDVQKACRELDWTPKVSLESGVRRMIRKAQADQGTTEVAPAAVAHAHIVSP